MIQKHRISTDIGKDQKITVELKQDFDVLEILSLKFNQQDIYTSICSDYGVVCGRVTANNGFGVGNARVSIFIPLTTQDENDPVISKLYPYKEVGNKDENNYRYNLLPSRQQHGGHAATGTFPDQRDILTREEVLEVYEKYYRYTVKTNSAGDFMIWGVPIGNQTIHVDVDLSDIGCFSLRPYDFIRQGVGVDAFKNKYSFKASEDLNSLPQIVSFDKLIEVYPFWGNEDICEIGITRSDFDLTEKGVKIQPKAYLIGGIYTDSGKNAVNKNCTPRRKMGRKCDMVAKSGKIEAIRFTPNKDELHRPYLEVIDLHEDIPDDGGFVLPLEMNMDYVFTNEFGENEITNDPNKGIPTSACYRLRINLNDNGLSRVRANADYLIPNIREFQTNGTIDDRSYYFGTEYSGYPSDAQSLILNNEGGEFYPQDYFYRFNYNKVYTLSEFHSHYIGNDFLGRPGFANITDLHPGEEEDCGDKLTPPSNFGFKNYSFTLLIADFLLLLDYIVKFIILQALNFLIKDVLGPFAELLIDIGITKGAGRRLRRTVSILQINNTTNLPLINYPECEECDGSNTGNCTMYDNVYDDNLPTGYYIDNGLGGRTYVPNITAGQTIIGVLLAGDSNYVHRPFPTYSGDGNIRDMEGEVWNLQALPLSHRSEFSNGVFTIVPGTQTTSRLSQILKEYYRRKRVGKMFCGGIVNYSFIDNWLSGSLYFLQFKVKGLSNIKKVETSLKYCRDLVRFVGNGVNRFYYRSAPFNGSNFTSVKHPTTFVDLGPRDEFIKEICIDQTLDPNCSVSRSIGASSYQDMGELIGLAINYRMDVAGANGNLDMFFDNKGFSSKVSLPKVLDGDILQLLSINNEVGIKQFDLQSSRYVGYQFNHLDPEEHPEFFKVNGDWGPLPVTFELDEDDGERVRLCLNEPTHSGYTGNMVQGRLTESSQKIPFYLWDKGGSGFGPSGVNKTNQSWDYGTLQVQPLQGMTYGYNIPHTSPNDDSDPYLLLPMTNNFSGLTVTGLDLVSSIEFNVISANDKNSSYDGEYPGYSYLYVPGWNGIDEPTSGTLYIRWGSAGNWQTISWNTGVDIILPHRQDYYDGNKQILSTPFQFYFGLNAGKTGMDKFIDLFGPKGAFPSAE